MTEATPLMSQFFDLLDMARGAMSDLARNHCTLVQPPGNLLLSLPYDVHWELFSWLAVLDPPSFSRDQLRGYVVKHLGWIAFAQTCRILRNVALEQPYLWARVVLVPASKSARAIFLEHSAHAGLTFRLNGNSLHPSQHGWLIQRPEFSQIIGNPIDLDFCAQHLARAAELSISAPTQWLSHLIGAQLPLLHTLHLCASDSAYTEVPHMPSEWLQAPNLVGAAFCDTKIPLYAPNLRFVALQNCNWVQQPDLIPPASIFGQLRAAPLLEEVKLHNVLTRNDYPSVMDEGPPIELPHLKLFCFRGSLSGLESLLFLLRIPEHVALDIELCGDFQTLPPGTCPLPTLVRRLATNFREHHEPATRFFEMSVYDRVSGELPYAWPGMSQTPWTRIDPHRLGIDRREALSLCIPSLSAAGVSMHSDMSISGLPNEPVYAPELRAALYTGLFLPFDGSQLSVLAIRYSTPKVPLDIFLEVLRRSPHLAELYLDEALEVPSAGVVSARTVVFLPSLVYVVYRGSLRIFKNTWASLDVPVTLSLHLGFQGEQIANSPEDYHFLRVLCAPSSQTSTLYINYLDLDWSLHGYFIHCESELQAHPTKRYTTFTGQRVSPGVHFCLNQRRSNGEHSTTYFNSIHVSNTFLSVYDSDKIDTIEFDFASLVHLRENIKTVLESALRRLLRVRRMGICHGAPLGQLYHILASTVITTPDVQAAHCFPHLDHVVERRLTREDSVWMENYRRQHGNIQTQWAALQGMVRDRIWFNKPIRCLEVLKPANFLFSGEDPGAAEEAFKHNLAYTLTLDCDVIVGELL